jgi:HK97 family phage prohead protease
MSWDGSASNFTDEQYARACVLDRGPDGGTAKQRYSLPVRDPSGALNCDGVAAARGRLNQVTGATDEQIAAARKKLDQLAAQCEKRSRPLGEFEERQLELSTDGQKIRGVIPYSVESRDLGGFTEVIEPTALRSTRLDDLVVTVDHAGLPLGRYPRTLDLEDRADGMHWAVDPPASRADVVEAIQRGDLQGGSWRMRVGRDEWRGDVRHVHEISELRDVSIVTHPSYPAAAVELRSQEEPPMPETVIEPAVSAPEPTETRSQPEPPPDPPRPPAGSLRVETRSSDERGGTLADCFRRRGFPGERAVIPWTEYEQRALGRGEFEDRDVTFSTGLNLSSMMRIQGAPLGWDQRYAWPAFPQTAIGWDTTSVSVVSQGSRTLATPASAVRPIDSTTQKPETNSVMQIVQVTPNQVATVQSNIPNVYLLQPSIDSVINSDLRLALNEALDSLVQTAIAAVTVHQDPTGIDLFTAVRKAITTLWAAGYNPDTLILDPASAETLDLSKATAADSFYQFAPNFAPGSIFGLNRRISKGIPHPAVVDTTAFGRLFASPVALANFEANNGLTNSRNVRMELQAVFGTERAAAAVRIATS